MRARTNSFLQMAVERVAGSRKSNNTKICSTKSKRTETRSRKSKYINFLLRKSKNKSCNSIRLKSLTSIGAIVEYIHSFAKHSRVVFIGDFISVQFFSVEKILPSIALTASNSFGMFFASGFSPTAVNFSSVASIAFNSVWSRQSRLICFGGSGRAQLFDHASTNFSTAATNFSTVPQQIFDRGDYFFDHCD